jgi:hypothetical protein
MFYELYEPEIDYSKNVHILQAVPKNELRRNSL